MVNLMMEVLKKSLILIKKNYKNYKNYKIKKLKIFFQNNLFIISNKFNDNFSNTY